MEYLYEFLTDDVVLGTEWFDYSLVLVATESLDYNLGESESHHTFRKKREKIIRHLSLHRQGPIGVPCLPYKLLATTYLFDVHDSSPKISTATSNQASSSTFLVPAKLKLL